MSDNFNASWLVPWSKFARKQIFIPKRLDSMFGRALVPGWRPFVNKVYNLRIFSGVYFALNRQKNNNIILKKCLSEGIKSQFSALLSPKMRENRHLNWNFYLNYSWKSCSSIPKSTQTWRYQKCSSQKKRARCWRQQSCVWSLREELRSSSKTCLRDKWQLASSIPIYQSKKTVLNLNL